MAPHPLMEALEPRLLLSNGFLQGTAFLDTNQNNQLDAGEAYLAGAQVQLYNEDGTSLIGQTTTDAQGAYCFDGLTPGAYRLVETPPSGYVNRGVQVLSQVNPASALDLRTIQVTVADPSTLTVSLDIDDFFVRNRYETVQVGFLDQVLSGSMGQIPCLVSGPGVSSSYLTLCSDPESSLDYGINIFSANALAAPPAPALSQNVGRIGYLFNHYGMTDLSMTGLSKVDGAALQAAIWELEFDATPDLGSGNFGPVIPWAPYTDPDEVNAIVARANAYLAESAGRSEAVTFLDPAPHEGQRRQGVLATGSYNFANIRAASLAGFNYVDANNDGVFQGTETPIGGTTIRLVGTDDLGAVSRAAVTGADGSYLFADLRPGTYTVTETQNPSYLDGKDTQGTPGTGTAGNDVFVDVLLASGVNGVNNNFGELLPATIGNFVWSDTNADGIQNDGSTGINGVALTLTGTDGAGNAVTRHTTTVTNVGQAGYYQFANLVPGTYVVTVDAINPALTGFTASPTGQGSNPALDSNAQPAATSPVFLPSGGSDQTLDFGYYNPTPGIEIIKDVLGTAIVAPNTPVTFTYSVWNTGGVPISSVVVADDNATPDFAEDDFNPTPVLSGGFNIGDTNQNNLLDTTETWKYSTTVIPPVVMTVTPAVGGPTYSSGTLSYETLANGDVRVYYRQDNNFNDNTYGTGSDAGWTSRGKTHRFSDLTNSDKAGFLLKYSDGTVLAQFYQDYVTLGGTNTEGYAAWSGYQSLGFSGGDGSWVAGSTTAKTWLIDFDSTLETDLNQSGIANNGIAYTAMTVNSPVGDAKWDVVDGYAFTISAAAFTGGKSFGGVTIFDQHNSPAKTGGSNTYIPDIIGGASVNTATVTGVGNGTTVTDNDSATVEIVTGPLGLSSLSGYVYYDSNNDGEIDFGELGIAGVTVKLTGINDLGQQVSLTTQTDSDGAYVFNTLRPGTYTITETQPANYLDGKDTVGTRGGTVGNDVFSQITLAANTDGINYNFGELQQAGTPVGEGQTATIGFWHNKNGQALIKSLNGGKTATNLANWLASNFPNLYGSSAGSKNNLTGKTNADVADVFLKLFSVKGQKLDAQVMAVALATYVTNSSLAGTAAVRYGFSVTAGGTAASTFNVGTSGLAFGVANNTTLTVLQILQAANTQAVNGVLYNGNTALRNAANTVFDGINTAGDIK
ncbi:MAG: SpaA isopeptide-forming pilin-related protein [Planctomycetota bacterium]|nr:SpaA isopeptide-forming pilin-related protein [Planctomycetota bacterium]